MKEIDLPLKQTVSMTIDLQAPLVKDELIEEDGRYFRNLGSVGAEQFSEMAIARKNGGKVLFTTTSIEADIDDIISSYFMGNSNPVTKQKNIFDRELLKSSILNFSAKKELLKKIIHSTDILKRKKKDDLEQLISQVMKLRNAFAHGKISYDTKDGCFIEFYSGKVRTKKLNDKFWDTLVRTYEQATALLDEAKNNLSAFNK